MLFRSRTYMSVYVIIVLKHNMASQSMQGSNPCLRKKNTFGGTLMFPRKMYKIVYEGDGEQGVLFFRLNRKGKITPGNIDALETELSEETGTEVLIVNVVEMN